MYEKNLNLQSAQASFEILEVFPPISYKTNPGILKLNDAEIYYEVSGSGPAVIFAHGLGGNHLSWWQQIPYFSDRYTCINFSHRGFTISKNYSGRVGHSVFAEDLAALIDHLNLKEVSLVAQSMGGWTCMTYALQESKKVKAVVMSSSSGLVDFRQSKHPEIRSINKWDEWAKREKSSLKENGILNAIGFEMAKEQPALTYLYEQIYNLTLYSYKEFIGADIKRARNLSPEVLKNLEIPFLFLTGEKDVLFPPAGAFALTSVMQNAESFCFKNSGHSVYFERAELFNQTVDNFLSKIYDIPVREKHKK